MKTLLFLLLLSGSLSAQTIRINGEDMSLMRLNFGVKTPVLRTTISYFSNPSTTEKKNAYGYLGNSESGMLTNLRVNADVLVMLNNQNLQPGEVMSRSKFINASVSYDDFLKRMNFSINYAQNTECLFNFMGFIKLKGYWLAGINNRFERSIYAPGVKLGFNGYDKHVGLESSVTYYPSKTETDDLRTVVNVQLYRTIYKKLLITGGLVNNLPNAGLCFLSKRSRFGVGSFYSDKFHLTGSWTYNL